MAPEDDEDLDFLTVDLSNQQIELVLHYIDMLNYFLTSSTNIAYRQLGCGGINREGVDAADSRQDRRYHCVPCGTFNSKPNCLYL